MRAQDRLRRLTHQPLPPVFRIKPIPQFRFAPNHTNQAFGSLNYPNRCIFVPDPSNTICRINLCIRVRDRAQPFSDLEIV